MCCLSFASLLRYSARGVDPLAQMSKVASRAGKRPATADMEDSEEDADATEEEPTEKSSSETEAESTPPKR